jgi:Sap, sulfolipid-1-addressing protein
MVSLLLSLLPLIVGASLGGPAWIIIALVLLRGEGGLAKAAAFLTGAMTVRLLQFVLFSRVFGAIVSAEGEDVFDLIPATLLLVAGLLLLITAARTWWNSEDDPDAPPPKWMTALGSMSALRAFGMATVLMAVGIKQWVFTLSAIALIDEAKVSKIGSVLAYLFFIVAAHSLTLSTLIGSAVAPSVSAKCVQVMLGWLERNNRWIKIIVSLAFGTWFLARGMSGLAAHGSAKVPAN